jgi:hypothetical protein
MKKWDNLVNFLKGSPKLYKVLATVPNKLAKNEKLWPNVTAVSSNKLFYIGFQSFFHHFLEER